MPTPQYNFYKHRKGRQNVSAFSALITTPAAVEVVLPANGRFRFVATAGAIAGELAATLTGSYVDQDKQPVQRLIQTPVLAAGGYVTLDQLERGVTVTLEASFELWVDTGLGRFSKIAGNP